MLNPFVKHRTRLFFLQPRIVIIPDMSAYTCTLCTWTCGALCSGATRLAVGESRRLRRRRHPAAFHCQAVTDCGEGALASCLDMEAENAERGETACGTGGMDGCRRAWPLDKESDSCYRGLRNEGGRGWGGVGGGCWTGGGPHRPFIYFDPRAAGGPGRAHAKLPRRAEPPQPPSHLSARPSVSGQIYVCLWPGYIGGGDTALF